MPKNTFDRLWVTVKENVKEGGTEWTHTEGDEDRGGDGGMGMSGAEVGEKCAVWQQQSKKCACDV